MDVTEAGDVVTENANEGSTGCVSAITPLTHIENLNPDWHCGQQWHWQRTEQRDRGYSASNTLIGGAGNDTMEGGTGNDTYEVREISDGSKTLA
jgi:hypothetical protein